MFSFDRTSSQNQLNICLFLWGIVFGIVGISLIISNSVGNVQNVECTINSLNFDYYNCSTINETVLCTDCIIHYQYNKDYNSVTYHCGPNEVCVEKWVKFAQTKHHMCYKLGDKIHWGYFDNNNKVVTYIASSMFVVCFIFIFCGTYNCCRKDNNNSENRPFYTRV